MFGSKTRQLTDLVVGLDKNRFNIEIGAVDIGDEATNDVLSLGVPIREIRVEPPRTIDFNKFKNFIKSPLLLSRKYDIVHSLHYSSLFFEPLFVKLCGSANYVYTKSNLQWDNHPLNWQIKSMLSDKIISISNDVNKLLHSKGLKNKSTLIPLGIDTDFFNRISLDRKQFIRNKYGIPVKALVFGCAAQLIKSKKHDVLMSAFIGLAEKYPDIYLVLCGQHYNDSYYNEIIGQLSDSIFSNRIKYLGTLSDMREFYGLLDCFVLPSVNEAFGLVYIEALSSGVPVIGCLGGGAEDIIFDSNTGFLVESDDVTFLASTMKKYIDDLELSYKHGQIGRNHAVANFSKEVMVKSHENIYLRMAGAI